MKPNITKGLDVTELQRQAYDAQEQLFRLRFQMGMGQTEGLKKYRTLRKDRARLLTVLREKQLAGETIPAPLVAPKPADKKKGLLAKSTAPAAKSTAPAAKSTKKK